MYNTIINPKTNRLVNINSKLGKSIVINYFNKINGGAKNKEFCEINEKTNRCKGTNTDPNDGKCLKNPKTARCKMTNNYKNSEHGKNPIRSSQIRHRYPRGKTSSRSMA